MEKDKSRGIKHIKDKRKYKGNSVKDAKHVPPKNKPNLGTNWDRYNSDEDNEHEHKLSSSTDFSLLSNVPISTGSHFQFKNDKLEEDSISEHAKLFCLDLDLLHKSMLTIPFYEKLGIEKYYFKDTEINTMDQVAQKELSIYSEFIQSKDPTDTIMPESSESDKSAEKLQENLIIPSDKDDDILELIDNCSIHSETDKVPAELTINVGDNSKQDLEQWLEDILED